MDEKKLEMPLVAIARRIFAGSWAWEGPCDPRAISYAVASCGRR